MKAFKQSIEGKNISDILETKSVTFLVTNVIMSLIYSETFIMNLGIESEILEFKKTTGEINKAVDNIASMLNKHGHGTLFFGVSPNSY